MVQLINLRYKAERLAYEKARSGENSSPDSPYVGDMSASQMKEFGILVNK